MAFSPFSTHDTQICSSLLTAESHQKRTENGDDLEYYAWLRHKLTLAEKALETGKIAYETFDTLLTRFNEVHMWAVDKFGRETLAAAMESVDRKNYAPPGGQGQKKLAPVPNLPRKG